MFLCNIQPIRAKLVALENTFVLLSFFCQTFIFSRSETKVYVLQGNLNVSMTMNVIKSAVKMVSNLINSAKSQELSPLTINVTLKRRITRYYVCKGMYFSSEKEDPSLCLLLRLKSLGLRLSS